MLADRYADDKSVRERFKREALAAARLSGSPSIITIFDVGESDGHPYIVMECLEGGSLEDRLRAGGAQDPADVIRWLDQAAGALDAAHAAGVVHRDVKPGNLLLNDRGEVSVADFGIASAVGLDSMTMTGTVLGTAGYLAPEQAKGERATPASDRYGLGVVAYELLTGERPSASSQRQPRRPRMSMRRSRIPVSTATPSRARPGAPAGSGQGAERALRELGRLRAEMRGSHAEGRPRARGGERRIAPAALPPRGAPKDPDERYGSAVELVADLRAALRKPSRRAHRRAPPPEAGTADVMAAPAAPRTRGPGGQALAAAALVAAGLVGARRGAAGDAGR